MGGFYLEDKAAGKKKKMCSCFFFPFSRESETPSFLRGSWSGFACYYSYSYLLRMMEVIFYPLEVGGG